MANLPELEDSGEPTIVEMVKQQEISNFYLEQIRDILIKGFNLDKKSFEEDKKSFLQQKFSTAEKTDEAVTPVPDSSSTGDEDTKSKSKFDMGLLGKLLAAGAFLFFLDNPDAIDFVVDGAVRLVNFFKDLISGIKSIYDAIVPNIPDFLTSNESVNKFLSDALTASAPFLVGLGAALILFPKTTSKIIGGMFSMIGKTFSKATSLLKKSQVDTTANVAKKSKFGFGKRFGKLAGLVSAGIAGVTAAMFVKAESDVNKATGDMDTRAKNTERVKNLSPEKKKLMTDAGYKVSDTGAVTDASGRNVKASETAAALDNAERGRAVTPRTPPSPASPSPTRPAPAASPSPMKPAASAATSVAANDNVLKTASQSKSVVKSVAKVMGKFGVKAIPIVGTLAGVGFAVERLISGDFVGASAEGAGIFLPTLAGAPLDLGIAAREVYNDTYQRSDNQFPLEEDLIQDPQMVGDRMEDIYKEIKKQLSTNQENAKPRGRMKRGQQLRAQSQVSGAEPQTDLSSSMEPGGPSASFQGPANENVEGQMIDAVSRTNVNQMNAPVTINHINSTDASTSVKNENVSAGPIDPVNRDTSLFIGSVA